jgi:diguanylate cyclase (GGDEF)-like protein/PAS domain S-box-containing protein
LKKTYGYIETVINNSVLGFKTAIAKYFSPVKDYINWKKRSDDLESSLALVKATLESTADGILVVNKNGSIVDCNQKFIAMWRIPMEIMSLGDENAAFDYVLSQVKDPQSLAKEVKGLQDSAEESGDLTEVHFKDDRVFERYSQPFRIGGEIAGRVWSFRDITERRKIAEALRLRERAIESSANGIMIIDIASPCSPKIVYVNQAFSRITGYSSEEVIERDANFLISKTDDQNLAQRLQLAMNNCAEDEIIIKSYRKDGSLFWNQIHLSPVSEPNGEVKYYVSIWNDITEFKNLEEQLLYQATHDTLTHLPNRSLLLDRIQQAIFHCGRTHRLVAILFIDLDKFKLVNDSMGHTFGDKLLGHVAQRLTQNVREIDTVARMGGDEFLIVLPGLINEEEALTSAQRIIAKLNRPFLIEEKEINVTASIGICFYPQDAQTVDALIKGADMSMYLAKDSGRNNYQRYSDELNRRITKRMDLENKLRTALERNEFIIYYQPLFDLGKNEIIGMEALIRWQHPELGFVMPAEFIPIAEEDGLIIAIGKWVLRTAIIQLMQWHAQGYKNLCLAVNLSGRQLYQPDIVASVEQVLLETGVNPVYLELELTETILLDNIDENITKLRELKALGLKLAIDDFGTGYSSLKYLKQFPIDKLKIDLAFIRDVTVNPNNAAITTAIINLGKTLNLTVLAEGIETKEQLQFLQKQECDQGQGYLFSQPIPAEKFTQLLQKIYYKENTIQ